MMIQRTCLHWVFETDPDSASYVDAVEMFAEDAAVAVVGPDFAVPFVDLPRSLDLHSGTTVVRSPIMMGIRYI